jgi:hypothetical protein
MERALSRMVACCRDGEASGCPLVETLSADAAMS